MYLFVRFRGFAPASRCIRRRRQEDEARPESRRDQDLILGADDDTLNAGGMFDERHAGVGTEHKHALGQRIGDDGSTCDERDAPATPGGLTDAEIENVMVAAAVLDEETLVVARGAERAVGQIECSEALVGRPARIADAEAPRTIATSPGDIEIAPRLDHEIAQPVAMQDIDRP